MRFARGIALGILLFAPLAAGVVGKLVGPGTLHPARRPLTPEAVAAADRAFTSVGAHREQFDVRASDGTLLRGWKVRPGTANGDWVLLFHGVSDNRTGMLGHAEFLLRSGHGVLMMDARAHGASDGDLATYGWKERGDTRTIVNALYASEPVHCLFALGESMGAAIALQSATIEPRIAGTVAESSFSNLREVSYDYAGLHLSPWLGKTLFLPAAFWALREAEREGGFQAGDISPEQAVAQRKLPLLLICGTADRTIPCRHSERIDHSAVGPKQLWEVRGAEHAAALGAEPQEFARRVTNFYQSIHAAKQTLQSSK